MSNSHAPFVSIHPYFRVHPGKLEEFRALLPRFVERTQTEEKNLSYDFTIAGDTIYCREGYIDAAALLAHLENVDELLKKALTLADLARLEVHGPESELAKLKAPLASLDVTWFAYVCGVSH
ncbi:MAG: antibiotic biosynthesis monooxygenase [Verrucomicrobia bacterium]|nr:antibiotic biosynthesis monooxygenase [Verrucomicrobiota bacterium]